MKKLLSLAAAFLLCAGVQAQIVSSRSVSIKSAQKQPSETREILDHAQQRVDILLKDPDGTMHEDNFTAEENQ